MLDLLEAAARWRPLLEGQRVAIATVIGVSGSAPRPVGTSLLMSDAGTILGSLSGGCVEGGVCAIAEDVLADGVPRREHFAYSDDDAMAVGLSCGGAVEVYLELLPESLREELLANGLASQRVSETSPRLLALVRELDDSGALTPRTGSGWRLVFSETGSSVAQQLLQNSELDGSNWQLAGGFQEVLSLIGSGKSALLEVGSAQLLVESRLPAPRLLIFGANDFSAALIRQGKLAGYNVALCDPRSAFTSQDNFAVADSVINEWPHNYLRAEASEQRVDARTVICILSHDPKFEIPLLEEALSLALAGRLAYVGAMGSRSSHRKRLTTLTQSGVSSEALALLHSPIGLDIGASSPAEVAISIIAEVVAARNGKASSAQLRNGKGSIHAIAAIEESHLTLLARA